MMPSLVEFLLHLGQFLSNYWSCNQWYLAHAYVLAWPLECSHSYLTLIYISWSMTCYVVLLVNIIIMNLGQNVCLDHLWVRSSKCYDTQVSVTGLSWHSCSLSPRFLEKASGILLSPPSICPLCYLLPNRWTESNQIWWVACLHKWGMQEHVYFWPCPPPPPRGPGEGSKGQILTISNFRVNFKDFYAKMCTYTQ